jgi:hypothetical protein
MERVRKLETICGAFTNNASSILDSVSRQELTQAVQYLAKLW